MYAMAAHEGSYTATTGSYVLGSTGDDLIYGSGENVCSSAVRATIIWTAVRAATSYYGGEGNDILMFNASNTVMDGGTGIDFLVGADLGSLDTLLAGGAVSNIDVIVTGAGSVKPDRPDQS